MFVARQPIFDKRMKVYGYELLFRANQESNSFSNTSAKAATALVMGDLFELGISKVTGNAKAFVNFDYEFIMSDMIELIDPEALVIEEYWRMVQSSAHRNTFGRTRSSMVLISLYPLIIRKNLLYGGLFDD